MSEAQNPLWAVVGNRGFEPSDRPVPWLFNHKLWAAGCDLDTARFVARQLAKDGYALVKADKFDAMLKAEHDKIAGLVMVLRAYEPETEYERGFDDACAAVLREIRALAQEDGE